MLIDEITTPAELNRVLLSERRGVLLDFWGTWCQPCRSLRPHLEALAESYKGSWRLLAVHVENSSALTSAYQVQSTPTLVYLQAGDEVARSTGAVTPSAIAETLERLQRPQDDEISLD